MEHPLEARVDEVPEFHATDHRFEVDAVHVEALAADCHPGPREPRVRASGRSITRTPLLMTAINVEAVDAPIIAMDKSFEEFPMGKGDKRSFKGKVFKGSYGKTRLRKITRKKTATTVKKK
jgi:ribosomal small subunit protein bTHX